MTTTTTPATWPCQEWTRPRGYSARVCGKPATVAWSYPQAAYAHDARIKPVCPFHVKVAQRRSYQTAVPVPIEGEVLAYLVERREKADAARAADMAAKAERQREQHAANTARLWAEEANEWTVVYAPETDINWSKASELRAGGMDYEQAAEAATYEVPVWKVQPVDPQAYVAPWEIRVESPAGQPAKIGVHRTGDLTPAAAAALAAALTAAAEKAEEITRAVAR